MMNWFVTRLLITWVQTNWPASCGCTLLALKAALIGSVPVAELKRVLRPGDPVNRCCLQPFNVQIVHGALYRLCADDAGGPCAIVERYAIDCVAAQITTVARCRHRCVDSRRPGVEFENILVKGSRASRTTRGDVGESGGRKSGCRQEHLTAPPRQNVAYSFIVIEEEQL